MEQPERLRAAIAPPALLVGLALVGLGLGYGLMEGAREAWSAEAALVVGSLVLVSAWGVMLFARPRRTVRVPAEVGPAVVPAVQELETGVQTQTVDAPPTPPSPVLDLVPIPAGQFTMGSPPEDELSFADEKPPHPVTIRAFWLAKTVVTRATYRKVMGTVDLPWREEAGKDDLPANSVSWRDAVAFCNRLSELEGLEACYEPSTFRLRPDANGYRLPSEAEWEYACRAGTRTQYWSGDSEKDLARVGWYRANSNSSAPHPVGQRPANPFGLFDMHGNVWEWCGDTWHKTYAGAPDDGSAWIDDSSEWHVLRGGSFVFDARIARSAYRRWVPVERFAYVGFRPARSVSPLRSSLI